MPRAVAGLSLAVLLAACSATDRADAPGYRLSVPGAFVGRFPPNPFDPEAEILIEGAYGMAVGPEQDGVFVLDRRGRRVFHLDRDANLRAAFGRPGGGPGEFEAPVSIQLDPGGDVWVSDARLSRLSRFGAGGDLRDELSTPWPVTNFGILRDGVSIYPTVEQTTLLAVQSGAEHREMEIDPAVIPDGISAHPMERLMSGALQFFPLEPNTVLMFQNRNAELFGAWRIELDPPGTRVTEVATWPLPDWIVAETESRGGVIEVEQQGERTRISEMVPFNSVRVVDDELWLVTGLIDDVLAASIPLVEGDSASIVLPPETAIDCLMDVAVLGERLVVLCETEVRFYELDRVESERFSPP